VRFLIRLVISWQTNGKLTLLCELELKYNPVVRSYEEPYLPGWCRNHKTSRPTSMSAELINEIISNFLLYLRTIEMTLSVLTEAFESDATRL
jgi:hypothetical protein